MDKNDLDFSKVKSDKELADLGGEMFARFFWEYWHYMNEKKKTDKKFNN